MTRMKNSWVIALALFGLLALGGCEGNETQPPATPEGKTAAPSGQQDQVGQEKQIGQAVAVLEPTQGNTATGRVTFESQNGNVLITGDFESLPPGKHGFHIHEKGDCSAPDASSAGGHYNPDNTPHGSPEAPSSQRHVGDLGNLEVAQDGTAHYERIDSVISLTGTNSIVGKAVIVHADADDLTSQPTGNAGSRLTCGVIEMEK